MSEASLRHQSPLSGPGPPRPPTTQCFPKWPGGSAWAESLGAGECQPQGLVVNTLTPASASFCNYVSFFPAHLIKQRHHEIKYKNNSTNFFVLHAKLRRVSRLERWAGAPNWRSSLCPACVVRPGSLGAEESPQGAEWALLAHPPKARQPDPQASPDTDLNAVICKGTLLKDIHRHLLCCGPPSSFTQGGSSTGTRRYHPHLSAELHCPAVPSLMHQVLEPEPGQPAACLFTPAINVLLNASCLVKLCDFGLARPLSGLPEGGPGPCPDELCGHGWYRAQRCCCLPAGNTERPALILPHTPCRSGPLCPPAPSRALSLLARESPEPTCSPHPTCASASRVPLQLHTPPAPGTPRGGHVESRLHSGGDAAGRPLFPTSTLHQLGSSWRPSCHPRRVACGQAAAGTQLWGMSTSWTRTAWEDSGEGWGWEWREVG